MRILNDCLFLQDRHKERLSCELCSRRLTNGAALAQPPELDSSPFKSEQISAAGRLPTGAAANDHLSGSELHQTAGPCNEIYHNTDVSCGREDDASQASQAHLASSHDHASSHAGLGPVHGAREGRRLRILCLHGFRQSASSFRGRSSALAKRISCLANLVFVDAPHMLPHFVKGADACSCIRDAELDGSSERQSHTCQHAFAQQRPRRAWLLEPAQLSTLKVMWPVARGPRACR